MSQYKFNGVEIPEVFGVAAPMPARIGEADTPMRHGGFSGRQFMDARQITVQGVWLASPGQAFMDMEVAFAAYCSSLLNCGTQRLYLRDNWFYNAVCKNAVDSDRESGSIQFDLTFKLADPRSYREVPSGGMTDAAAAAAITSGTTFDLGGDMNPPYSLSLVLTGATADYLTLTSITGESFAVKPTDAGTLIASSNVQGLSRSGFDATSELAGSIFNLAPTGNKITVAGSSPDLALLSSMSVAYREASL